MMELLRTWLIGITAAAIVLALADSLSPEGTVKKIGKLAGGLLLITAILRPVIGLDYETMAAALTEYRVDGMEYSDALEIENVRLMKIIIEDRTGAYIEDKAAQAGIDCTAEVTCRVGENETVYPAAVVLRGALTQEQIEYLTRLIEGELAVSPQNQHYERTNTS